MDHVIKIARKEFTGFFSTPVAYIFFGVFLAITLFIFFWVETFFARNIADVRPLFEWMPVLMIFLVAAITMRMWAEERRSGTLEFLLTAPVKSLHLVLGKFSACLALIVLALALTLPLPVTVSLIGPLDWGPVIGGYIAAVFLAAAYIAIGLYASSRALSQIFSLILTVSICGIFYLIGADKLTALFGNEAAELLKLLGSGARFDSITRGMIDVRDLYYYVSLVGVFLALNILALEKVRWAGNPANPNHRNWKWLIGLLAANFIAANLWLAPVSSLRTDMTQGRIYSISDVTRGYLMQLQEPMLIRGYFSAQTHPLLAPLVPRLRDLLKEYALAGDGRLRVEFVDPQEHPELEQEANEKYGIRAVPFQFASKYQSSVVNSYFNILIQYGDQHVVLGFQDLIELKIQGDSDLTVDLRNPEYDLTQAIKKTLYAYQGSGTLFDNIAHPVSFKGYISADDKLPEVLKTFRADLDSVLLDLQQRSDGKLSVEILDPDDGGGALAAQIETDFGLRPMTAGFFETETFWFYMMLEGNSRLFQVPLPENLEKNALEQSILATLKRFSKGFLKTIAVHAPAVDQSMAQFGQPGRQLRYGWLQKTLSEEHDLVSTNLRSGQLPDETDLLVLMAPENLDAKQLFAVDQFLMRGGTVVAATSPFLIELQGSMSAQPYESGLGDWLSYHGITVEQQLVLDAQNAAFPVPVDRRIGGFVLQETRMIDYPYFIDIREKGIDQDSSLASGINQITMTWASPIVLDEQYPESRKIIRLLESSGRSWTSDNPIVKPDFETYPDFGFPSDEQQQSHLLAVIAEGRFESYFKDKASPLAVAALSDNADHDHDHGHDADINEPDADESEETVQPVITRVIDHSPESARIILFASNDFLADDMINLASMGLGTRYTKPVELLENAIDWSLEERELLAIRGRSQFSRTLDPLNQEEQIFWEYLNYGLALTGLLLIGLTRRWMKRQAQLRYAAILNASSASGSIV